MLRRSILRKGLLIVAVAIVAAIGLAAWWVSRPPKPENLHLTTDQWRDDLHFLAPELPKRHANAFHFTSQAAFEKAVADLDAELPQLNADETWVGMQRLVSLVGDGHTYLQTPQDSAAFPIDITRFGQEYRVDEVDPAYPSLLGTRVVTIGNAPVQQAADRCKELFSRDENPPAGETFIETCLTTAPRYMDSASRPIATPRRMPSSTIREKSSRRKSMPRLPTQTPRTC
jgi:hypothetical protein